jgi:hypothetical protein
MKVKNRKGVFNLKPDSIANYRRLYVDVFSIAASLSQPEELFASAAEAGLDAVFVVDAWHESHMPLARRYLELCQRHMRLVPGVYHKDGVETGLGRGGEELLRLA